MTERNSTEQQPTIYHPIIWRLELPNSEKPSRDTYIKALGELPDFVLKANQILASNLEGNFQKLLNHYREVFKAIQKWIVHFDKQSHDSSLSDPPELRFSWEFDFKPHAEESWALLSLCQEIVKLAPLYGQDFLKVTSATELWWSCHFERLQETFFKNGIFSKQPELQGKQYSCDVMSKRIREDFDTLHQRKFADSSEFDLTKIATWDATEEALRMLAEDIAQQDDEFRRLIYSNYIKFKKRVVRSARNNPNLQLMVLQLDGSLHVGGKSKRGKGKKPSQSKKGFVKKNKD